jgi:hypothetical protein
VTTRTLATAVLALSAVGLGCGGGSGAAGDCGRTQPCGGDLTGTWTVTGGCWDTAVAASGSTLHFIGRRREQSRRRYSRTRLALIALRPGKSAVFAW